jgi:hypothetical protein
LAVLAHLSAVKTPPLKNLSKIGFGPKIKKKYSGLRDLPPATKILAQNDVKKIVLAQKKSDLNI